MPNNKGKIETKTLPGFAEYLPKEQIVFEKIKSQIANVFELFGFCPLDTPVIERSEVLFLKTGGETEKQIYRIEKGETELALRFDLTVPLARYVSENFRELAFPFKRYQIGKVYRGESPQKGRFREFYQCDIDVLGNGDLPLEYDAEMISVINKIFTELNFGKFNIKISNRKIISGLLEEFGFSNKKTETMRVLDKIYKIGKDSVLEELEKIGLQKEVSEKLIQIVSLKGEPENVLENLKQIEIQNTNFKEGVLELEKVIGAVVSADLPTQNFSIDLSIVRGLDYYTGTVIETVLVDRPEFGSVCGGGRYENLIENFSSQKIPGVGVSIGITRLFGSLLANEMLDLEKKTIVDILIIPLTKNSKYVSNVEKILRKKR